MFVPFELLKPLANVPPKSGTRWRANFYRMDYDDDKVFVVGLGARRPQFPRVSEVRHDRFRVGRKIRDYFFFTIADSSKWRD